MLRYKCDSEKYTVKDRHVDCRGAWYLKDYDVNKAGQVHAYICDLRRLPYQEQLYWKSFNEAPQAGISRRAVANDFEARWIMETDPLQEIKYIVENWKNSNVSFWKLSDESLIDRVNVPITSSRDEWSQAFVALAKLLIEGFQIKIIRAMLDDDGVPYNSDEKSLVLFEKLLIKLGSLDVASNRLDGLRTVQKIRSKVAAHVGGSSGTELSISALQQHGSYSSHFQSICAQVSGELKLIEQAFD